MSVSFLWSRWRAGAVVLVVGGAVASPFAAQAGFGVFESSAAPAPPRVSSAPLRPTISTRATVAFDRTTILASECSLDGSIYRPCRSPITFTGLARARHVFGVRARTSAGVTSAASAYAWVVARPHLSNRSTPRPLRPLLTTAPVRPWISRNATFSWLGRRSAATQCRLDGGLWKLCASPKTYLRLHLGAHVFRVRATRANGRRSGENRFGWRIVSSAAPPAPAITSSPDKDTTSTDAVFAFEVATGSEFSCRLDRSGWQQCSNPAIYVGLGTGLHTFCVRAVRTGVVAGAETCVTWTVHSPANSVQPSGAFTISGDVLPPLSPGVGAPLPLTVSNPFDFDLSVTTLTVAVQPGSSRPGCNGPTNLQVTQSNTATGSVSIVVPAHSTVTLPAQGATAPRVTMLDLATNQNACFNAAFTLSFSGSGTRA